MRKPNHLIQLVHRALSRDRKAQNQIILPNCQQIEKHYDYQMIEDYGYNYQMWDGSMNEIFGGLQKQLSASDMVGLKSEQRQWMKDRNATVQKRYDEGGGSLSRVVQTE
ncbi:DUF1311 domain-containing protein [Bacillus sp. 2CMS4F]|uniref:lysozyme inhibitor LprI family protein n=1 Tax=Bacillus sp. 2CMS4F TaxID=2929170 RepID=UPI0020BD720D|nr:lysozyme inhibitor LprI family protein [Bacillus sp. 2CMS4F]MCK8101838.1 DUF1311 domain-containing protein [Bacillus sp. 2CMS4F]